MNPIRFRKYLVFAIKLVIIIEIISAFGEGLKHDWNRFAVDLIIGGIVYLTWDRLKIAIQARKQVSKKKVQESLQNLRLWDALVFSVLWSDEIYQDIPEDRRRLIVISYTLIALGIAAAFIKIGVGLMPLVVTAVLILGAVNLLAWVVSTEREERESLQTELQLAHNVQVSLMPKEQPTVPGFDIAGISIPAMEVGGDHFDFTWLGTDKRYFGIALFDVSGKGMQAAMSAVFMSGAYTSEIGRSFSPGDILTRLNRALYTRSKRGHFVAFLHAVLDVEDKKLMFGNAGENRPLLKSSAGIEQLDGTGIHFPLGMKEDSVYQDRMCQLHSGDFVCFLSDGFTEAMNFQKDQFSMERMEKLISEMDTSLLSACDIIDKIVAAVRAFSASTPQHDDMTMVVVKVM